MIGNRRKENLRRTSGLARTMSSKFISEYENISEQEKRAWYGRYYSDSASYLDFKLQQYVSNGFNTAKLESCMKKKSISMIDKFKKMFLKQKRDDLVNAKIVEIAHVLYVANVNDEYRKEREAVQNDLRIVLAPPDNFNFDNIGNVYTSNIWDELFMSFNIPPACVRKTDRLQFGIDLYVGVNILEMTMEAEEQKIRTVIRKYEGRLEETKSNDPINYNKVIFGPSFLTDEPLALKF